MSELEERLKLLSRWRNDVSFILYDCSTDSMIYEKNADEIRSIGSITKLMTAFVLMKEKFVSEESFKETVTVDEEISQLSHNPAYSCGDRMEVGEQFETGLLFKVSLVPSGCASTLALVKHFYGTKEAFIEVMNRTCKEIGMTGQFVDVFGMDPYSMCSARDLLKLGLNFVKDYPQILNITSLHSVWFKNIEYLCTSPLIAQGIVNGMDGLKSGSTPAAGYCYLGTAERDGRRVISVVMNAQSIDEQLEETRTLLEYGLTVDNGQI